MIYIGDDPEPDVHGAQRAGLQPVWTTYVRDHKIPLVPGMIHSGLERPDFEVPQISSWEDLFLFLDTLEA
jgi:FMN phosphatase YigB (HAD superfamily)